MPPANCGASSSNPSRSGAVNGGALRFEPWPNAVPIGMQLQRETAKFCEDTQHFAQNFSQGYKHPPRGAVPFRRNETFRSLRMTWSRPFGWSDSPPDVPAEPFWFGPATR